MRCLLLYPALLCSFMMQAQGITFSTESWAEIKAQAATENKFIFVDIQTEWCQPCKQMAAEVFTLSEVGDAWNSEFISVTLDAENDEDGIALAKEFEVRGYPTLLFFNPDGTVVHRTMGSKNKDGLLALAKDAKDPTKQYYELKATYALQANDPEASLNFMIATERAGESIKPLLETYTSLTTEEDWLKPENWNRLVNVQMPFTAPIYAFAMQHRDHLASISHSDQVDNFFAYPRFLFLIKSSFVPEERLPEVHENIRSVLSGAAAAEMIAQQEAMWYERQRPAEAWPKKLEFLDQYCTQAGEFNTAAWALVKAEESDPEKLRKGLEWSEKALANTRSASYLDTKAWLLYRLGDHDAAKATATEILALAKASGEGADSTKELMHLLEQKQ